MGKVYDANGNPIAWSDVHAALGDYQAAAEALTEEITAHAHDPRASPPYAVLVGEDPPPDIDEAFDCLRCRFTFRIAAAAEPHGHTVGHHPACAPYAFCDC
jgi:hypothetical protein